MEAMTFEEFLYQRGHSRETVKTYLFQVMPFREMFPDYLTYNFRQVHNAICEMIKHQNSANYKNVTVSSIKRFYDYLVETGQRNDHPAKTITFQVMKKKGVIHADLFTSSELESLLDRQERFLLIGIKNRAITSLLIYQALQIRDIAGMKVQHVNLDSGKIYITGGRHSQRRHLDLHPRQYKIFDEYLNTARPQLLKVETDQLFVGARGTPVTKEDAQYLVDRLKGLFPDRRLSCETIRQSVISNWLNERRFPLEQVQLMAGHRWISTTAKYRQTSVDERRSIINRFHPLA